MSSNTFADMTMDDLLAQIGELENRLMGCMESTCVCGTKNLDPDKHWELCPYAVAAGEG